jgi:hypothetical protein
MKKRLLTVAFLSFLLFGNAQVQQLGTPLSWKDKVAVPKTAIEMVAVDNAAEAANESARRASTLQKDLRFGKELSVNINFINEAEVTHLPNGDVLRLLKIKAPGAFSINLIFDQFKLSKNAILYISDENKTEFIGAHTSLNNNTNNMLGTEIIHDDVIIIELVEPAAEAGTSILNIGTVVHGYLDLDNEVKNLGTSGDCEYDVNCPMGAGWENQRGAVAMMMDGGGFCTGSLLNNTSGSIIPYFISANHCGTNPGAWVFRFRWERTAANAICGTNNTTANNGPTNMFVNGAVLRASYPGSDVTLSELNSAPDPAWGIYYNGWNRTDIPATSVVGIHHPDADIKKISSDNTPVTSSQMGTSVANGCWHVNSWDLGVTEPGSSGSPLFDENHRTIGQLYGGASACGGANLSDEYGKMFYSWTGGGTNSTRLSNWLDPANTGATVIDGVDPAGPGAALDAGMSATTGVSGTQCSGTVTPTVTILNTGSDVLTSATVHYGYDGDYSQTYSWSGSLNQYQSSVISLPSATLSGGAHVFNAAVINPNAGLDENGGNDTITSDFTTIINAINFDLSITTDRYGDEITWEITNTDNTIVYYSGGPYAEVVGGDTYDGSYCLAEGCYEFVIADSYGDGMTSNGSPNGHVELTEGAATTTLIAEANANFGNDETVPFCLGDNGVNELASLQETWSLYPNPANDKVQFGFENDNELKEIQIITAFGNVVRTASTKGMGTTVDVSDLASGIYFVTLTSVKGTSTKQFVIK